MRTQKEWDYLAQYWDIFEHSGTNPVDCQQFHEEIDAPVAVIGAGQGIVLDWLRRSGFRAIGVDYSQEMVREAQRRYGVYVCASSAESLPFDEQVFSTVIISSGVLWVNRPSHTRRILAECRRILRPAGRAIVCFACFERQLLYSSREIGIVEDHTQHGERLFQLWSHRSDFHSREILIAKWTNCSVVAARALHARHENLLNQLVDSLSHVNDRLLQRGSSLAELHRAVDIFTLETFSVEQAVASLNAAELSLTRLNWGHDGTTLYTLTYPQR